MRLVDMLERSEALETRAAALYRAFAATRQDDAELAAMWTTLAAEEDGHARSIRAARSRLSAAESLTTMVEGCDAALTEAAQRLQQAEHLDADVSPDRQLAAALDLELSELETIRRLALEASRAVPVAEPEEAHLHRLADTAMRRSHDGHVRLGAALLLARARLAADMAARR
jgi:rubrerythrin